MQTQFQGGEYSSGSRTTDPLPNSSSWPGSDCARANRRLSPATSVPAAQAGFEVVSISSVAQARFREARYGSWHKNDPKDARVILAMLEHRLVQTYYDPLFEGTHDLQELSNTYYQVTLARTRLQHSLLTHHLPLYFPEFARYWYSTRSGWFIRFLIRFPIPSAIRELPRDRYVSEAWGLVGRNCEKQTKLEEI